MALPWVAIHNLTMKPGQGLSYSSTNFGLLGFILAHHAGVEDYLQVDAILTQNQISKSK